LKSPPALVLGGRNLICEEPKCYAAFCADSKMTPLVCLAVSSRRLLISVTGTVKLGMKCPRLINEAIGALLTPRSDRLHQDKLGKGILRDRLALPRSENTWGQDCSRSRIHILALRYHYFSCDRPEVVSHDLRHVRPFFRTMRPLRLKKSFSRQCTSSPPQQLHSYFNAASGWQD
jgi:hypothetical protein